LTNLNNSTSSAIVASFPSNIGVEALPL
jgi:hypothetical protein